MLSIAFYRLITVALCAPMELAYIICTSEDHFPRGLASM
jgi:hypothetical protein